MKILVSACLLGENCKYNGKNNYSPKLEKFLEGHVVIPVCPECLGGLPTPRPAAELRGGKAWSSAGFSVDEAYRKGAEETLRIALQEGAELAVLQSRSPSCGVKEIYDGSFSGRLIPGMGICAKKLAEAGIKIKDIEDIE